jgi:acetyl esterase/lipase
MTVTFLQKIVMLCAWALLVSPVYANSKSSVEPTKFATLANKVHKQRVVKNLCYRPGQLLCVGDLYLPESIRKPLPAVIVVHGGAWKSGSKEDFNALDATLSLLGENFIVFNINYRLTGDGGEFPNDVADVKHAAAFLRLNAVKYSIDENRIGIFGVSSGGHLALMAGYAPNKLFDLKTPNDIKAVAAFCPLTDLKSMEVAFVIQYLGCMLDQGRSVFVKASPVTYFKTSVPTLLIHGNRDRTVSIEQSTELAELLRQNQTKVEFIKLENADHFFSMKSGQERLIALGALIRFFKESL